MRSERLWRGVAIALCALVPGSFYLLGDATDAFPGVLTITPQEERNTARPPAQAEDWERTVSPLPMASPAAALPAPEASTDLAARMNAHANLPVVNGNLSYAVVDAATGTLIAERDSRVARTPASTLKLLTAAAVLRLYDEDDTLTTRIVLTDNTVTLEGHGDMLLSRQDLTALATQVAAEAKKQGLAEVTVALDDTALPGGENPAWGDNGRAGGWVAPTAALAVDRGRLDGSPYGAKSADPALDAARAFSQELTAQGVKVTGKVTRQKAPQNGTEFLHQSMPIGQIVRHTLLVSDNTTAELLGHLVALAHGKEAQPASAATAVHDEIVTLGRELGLPQEHLDALVIRDCSGLSKENQVPPGLLAAVTANVASGAVPQLEQILYDVPIAGYSGTLAKRFRADDTIPGRGMVRGKTGYLNGTASLTGVTVMPDGRTVGYAILVHGFDGANAKEARAAVDKVATEIVTEH